MSRSFFIFCFIFCVCVCVCVCVKDLLLGIPRTLGLLNAVTKFRIVIVKR